MSISQFLIGDELPENEDSENWISASIDTDTDNTVYVGVDDQNILDDFEISI